MSDVVLLAKLLLALGSCLITVVLLRRRELDALTNASFTVSATAALFIARIAVYGGVFGVLRLAAQSDVLAYSDLAHSAMAGLLPYRDFFNGYGPLFPFVCVLPLALWDTPQSIILFSIIVETVSLPIWLAFGRQSFGERVSRRAVVLYVFNPLATMSVALSGQNNVWLSLALAVSMYCVTRREVYSGLAFGAGVVAAKFLSLLHLPVILSVSRGRSRWILGFLAIPVAVYGFLFWSGVSIADQLAYHGSSHSSGNLPYFMTLLGVDIAAPLPNKVYNVAGLAVLGAAVVLVFVRNRHLSTQQGVSYAVLLLCLLMLVSRKALTGYLVIALFPLCLMLATELKKQVTPYLVFGVVSAMEQSLWHRWMQQEGLDLIWRTNLPLANSRLAAVAFLAVQVALLAFYVYFAVMSFRRLGFQENDEAALIRGVA